MWKQFEYFCKKNSNTLFNECGELYCGRSSKTFSIKVFSLSKSSNVKH